MKKEGKNNKKENKEKKSIVTELISGISILLVVVACISVFSYYHLSSKETSVASNTLFLNSYEDEIELTVGESKKISYTILSAEAKEEIWESSDNSVAIVSNDG